MILSSNTEIKQRMWQKGTNWNKQQGLDLIEPAAKIIEAMSCTCRFNWGQLIAGRDILWFSKMIFDIWRVWMKMKLQRKTTNSKTKEKTSFLPLPIHSCVRIPLQRSNSILPREGREVGGREDWLTEGRVVFVATRGHPFFCVVHNNYAPTREFPFNFSRSPYLTANSTRNVCQHLLTPSSSLCLESLDQAVSI